MARPWFATYNAKTWVGSLWPRVYDITVKSQSILRIHLGLELQANRRTSRLFPLIFFRLAGDALCDITQCVFYRAKTDTFSPVPFIIRIDTPSLFDKIGRVHHSGEFYTSTAPACSCVIFRRSQSSGGPLCVFFHAGTFFLNRLRV